MNEFLINYISLCIVFVIFISMIIYIDKLEKKLRKSEELNKQLENDNFELTAQIRELEHQADCAVHTKAKIDNLRCDTVYVQIGEIDIRICKDRKEAERLVELLNNNKYALSE